MPRKELSKPSEEFLDALITSGTSAGTIDCEFCGRVHIPDKSPGMDWEPGEFEELERKSKQEPDKYILHSEDTVHWGILDGRQYIADCPCNLVAKYERLFWKNRSVIESYFRKRAKRELEDAKRESRLAESVTTAVSTSR